MARKLLLADDSITIQKVISLTFADEDFEVICVGNGDIAVDKIRELRPDIVLADIFMPRKTGYEVCEFVKSNEAFRHIPVILLVGAFEPFDKNEAARVKADSFLTKPFETTGLVQLVQQTLAKAPPPSVSPSAQLRDLSLAAESEPAFEIPIEAAPPKKSTADQTMRAMERQLAETLEGIPAAVSKPPLSTELEKTLLSSTKPGIIPSLEADEVFLSSEEEVILEEPVATVPAFAGTKEGSAKATPTKTDQELTEEDTQAPPQPSRHYPEVLPEDAVPPEAGDNILEIAVFEQKMVPPPDDDILGIFEIINIEAITSRQKTLEESMQAETKEKPSTVAVSLEEEEVASLPLVSPPEAQAEEKLSEVEEVAPAEAAPAAEAASPILDENLVTRIAKLVVERLSEKMVREIAWEVVPEMAELLIKKEIEKLKGKGKL